MPPMPPQSSTGICISDDREKKTKNKEDQANIFWLNRMKVAYAI